LVLFHRDRRKQKNEPRGDAMLTVKVIADDLKADYAG
jgi:hypothetical protein